MEKSMFARVAPRDGLVAILSPEGTAESIYDIDGNLVAGGIAWTRVQDDFETLIVAVGDVNEAVTILRQRQDMSACLDMVLMLFDTRISLETREKLALSISTLLGEASIRNYVQDVLYSRPLPNEADQEGAKKTAAVAVVTSTFINQLIRKQPIIRLVYDTWLAVCREWSEEQDRIWSFACQQGVFRRIILEVVSFTDIHSIWRDVTRSPEAIRRGINFWSLEAFFERVVQLLPEIAESNKLSEWEAAFTRILSRHLTNRSSGLPLSDFAARIRLLAENVQLQWPDSGMHTVAIAELLFGFMDQEPSIADVDEFLKALCGWAGFSVAVFSASDMQQMRELVFRRKSADELAEWLISMKLRLTPQTEPIPQREASEEASGTVADQSLG